MDHSNAWTCCGKGLPVVAVNRVGHEPDPSHQTNGIQFWGSSFAAGPQGELLFRASDNEEEGISSILTLIIANKYAAGGPSYATEGLMNMGR